MQASVNTWQALNSWGGKSLFPNNSTQEGFLQHHVSFNRPYDTHEPAPLQWEIGLLRFLEREGYDVSYTTDVDTDRNPAELRRHRLVISSGHDEYWSKRMRDAFEAARDAGTNLAFLGADIADWQIRYENDRRTIVKYPKRRGRPGRQPRSQDRRFADLVPPRPECELRGLAYEGLRDPVSDPPQSYAVNPSALGDPWFAGTGFTATSALPDSVGYSWDTVQPGCAVPPLTVLFRYDGLTGVGTPWMRRSFGTRRLRGLASLAGARSTSSGGSTTTTGTATCRPIPALRQFMRNALADLVTKH